MEIDRAELGRHLSPRSPTRHRQGRDHHDPGPLGAQVRGPDRRLPGVLRTIDGDRQHRPDRGCGRDHRRAVDRRARHPADDADVPRRAASPAPTSRRACRASSSCSRRASRRAWRRSPRSEATVTIESTDKAMTVVVTDEGGEEHRNTFPRRTLLYVDSGQTDRARHAAQRGVAVSARAAGDPGPNGDRAVPRPRGSGGLQVPGRGHQRQAHRVDRAPDDEEGAR